MLISQYLLHRPWHILVYMYTPCTMVRRLRLVYRAVRFISSPVLSSGADFPLSCYSMAWLHNLSPAYRKTLCSNILSIHSSRTVVITHGLCDIATAYSHLMNSLVPPWSEPTAVRIGILGWCSDILYSGRWKAVQSRHLINGSGYMRISFRLVQ